MDIKYDFHNTNLRTRISLDSVIFSCPFDLACAIKSFALYRSGCDSVNAETVLYYCGHVADSRLFESNHKHYEEWFDGHKSLLTHFLWDLFDDIDQHKKIQTFTDLWRFISQIEIVTRESKDKTRNKEVKNES